MPHVDWTPWLIYLLQTSPVVIASTAIAYLQGRASYRRAKAQQAAVQEQAEARLTHIQEQTVSAAGQLAATLREQLTAALSESQRAQSSEQRLLSMVQLLYDAYVTETGHAPPPGVLTTLLTEAHLAHDHAQTHMNAVQQHAIRAQETVAALPAHISAAQETPTVVPKGETSAP